MESICPANAEMPKQFALGYSYDAKVIILFEIRPDWQSPEIKLQIAFEKIKHTKSSKDWKLYWMRASEAWKLYESSSKATHLEQIIPILKEDSHGCFFG